MSFSHPLDGNEAEALRISWISCEPSVLRVVLWIADRVVNNESVSGPDQRHAKKKKKKKEGEPFFPLLFKKLTSWPAAWSRVRICLPFLRIVEDENAERSESIFIWRRNRWQPLTEWRLTRPDSSSMMKWSSAIALFFFFPSSFHCLHLSLTLLLSHLFCHTHARFHAQTFLSIWLLLITAL